MAKKIYSLNDSSLIRDTFTKCMKDLVEKTDFDVMYAELNNTDIGRKRMSCVFILRADSSFKNSQELYNGITKENDEEFAHWFDAIKHSLNRTGNTNNGKHQEVWDKISRLLQDSKNESNMSCKLSKKVTLVKQHRNIKVILLGRSGSGKTRFFQYAIGDPVELTSSTIGTDIGALECQYQDIAVTLNLWDTAGQERFDAIAQNYYRRSNGALIFVDLCDFKQSDKREGIRVQTENLIQTLEFETGARLPCVLVGTKCDLVEQLSNGEKKAFTKLADSCSGGNWICTSAKSGFNVENALNLIVEMVMDDMVHREGVRYNADEDIIRLPHNPRPNFKQRVQKCFHDLC